MRVGEKSSITCPSSLIDGSLDRTDDINKDLGRRYEFEVLECDKFPTFLKPENLLEDKCFYIKVAGIDGQG